MALCACTTTPTAPDPVPVITPTVTAVSVSSTNNILAAGTVEPFTANVTKSDGSTQVVASGKWTSDAPLVATVDGAGNVSALTPGDATISLDVSTVRGSKRIAVRANLQGRWSGNYVVNSCAETQGFAAAGACGRLFPPNSGIKYTVELVLTQTSDLVAGQALFGTTTSPFTPARVAANSTLQINSTTHATTTSTANHTWNLAIPRAGQMEGTMMMVWSDTGTSGSMTVNTTLTGVTLVGIATARKP